MNACCLITVLVVSVTLGGLSGCTHSVGVDATTVPPWWEPHLTVDHELETLGLADIRLTRSRTESGFLRIVVEYFNRSDSKLSVIYRFTWFDAARQPVESILGNWQAVNTTLPRAIATVAGIAPRDDIENFHIELISAHRLKGQPRPTESER